MADQDTSEAATFAQHIEDLHNSYRHTAAIALGCPTGHIHLGWKLTHVDGTSRGGYQWPLPNLGGPGVAVEAANPDPTNTGSCPHAEGDGLCAVTLGHRREVTSGTVNSWSHAVGHVLAWAAADVLSTAPDVAGKMRLRRVVDLGVFDHLALVRRGLVADLRGAYLSGAYLSGAYLSGAYLSGAYLSGAYLRDADLRDADLRGADLRGADLRGADLRGADLRDADLRDANLRDAITNGRTVWPVGFNASAARVVVR